MELKITAIMALCVLECVAMFTGTDGAYLLPVVAIIAGLAGYVMAPTVIGKK